MADDRPHFARKRDSSLWKIRVKNNNKWPSESNSATLPTPPALKARARASSSIPKPPDASAGIQLLLVSPAAAKALKRKVLV